MNKKYLIITEGAVTEPNFLVPLFEKYGFIVYREEQINVEIIENNTHEFKKYQAINTEQDIVVIAQGPKNRIKDLMKYYENDTQNLERFFFESTDIFTAIFLIYDVDYTINSKLKMAFDKFNNEQDGLLLVSSPCIEVFAQNEDIEVNEIFGNNINRRISRTYKTIINNYVNSHFHISISQYILNNFERLALYYLEKNISELDSLDIMEHPSLVIKKINELNSIQQIDERTIEYNYRYFTTVLYVCLANILGLTKDFDNALIVKEFLNNKIN